MYHAECNILMLIQLIDLFWVISNFSIAWI